MKINRLLAIILISIVFLTSCEGLIEVKNKSEDAGAEEDQVVREIEYLKSQNQELIEENDELKDQIKELSLQVEEKDTSNIKTLEVDLNGDGQEETVKFKITGEYNNHFILSIDDLSITGRGDNLYEDIKIVDIDTTDNIKEIAVGEMGPSGDYRTSFYYYGLDNIAFMGKIEGDINRDDDIIIYGNGELKTRTRGQILHTWFYADYYKLTGGHILAQIPQDLYEMNYKVKVKKSIPLWKSRTDDEVIAELTPGEEVTILSSDNKEWCLVQKENGIKGWFAIEEFSKIKGTGYHASDVFEGLCYAD